MRHVCHPVIFFVSFNVHFGTTTNFSHRFLSIDCYCTGAMQNQLHHSYPGFWIATVLLYSQSSLLLLLFSSWQKKGKEEFVHQWIHNSRSSVSKKWTVYQNNYRPWNICCNGRQENGDFFSHLSLWPIIQVIKLFNFPGRKCRICSQIHFMNVHYFLSL